MLFSSLMEKYLDEELKPDVEKLLDLKMKTPEIGEGKRFDRINDYIEENIASIDTMIAALPKEEPNGWNELNDIFISLL